jgi:hypothetical protein
MSTNINIGCHSLISSISISMVVNNYANANTDNGFITFTSSTFPTTSATITANDITFTSKIDTTKC